MAWLPLRAQVFTAPPQTFTATQDIADNAVDAAGNTYVTGNFAGTAIVGGTLLTAYAVAQVPNQQAAYVAKFDPAGALAWVRLISTPFASGPFNSAGEAYATGVAVDGLGNVWVAGTFYQANFGFIQFAGSSIGLQGTPSGVAIAYVAKYNATGTCQWAIKSEPNYNSALPVNEQPGNSLAFSGDITADASGNAYMVGTFQPGNVNVASSNVLDRGKALTQQWVNNANVVIGTLSHRCTGNTVAGCGIGGSNFGREGYVVKLGPNGDFAWNNTVQKQNEVFSGSSSATIGNLYHPTRVVVDPNNNAYITGTFATSAVISTFTPLQPPPSASAVGGGYVAKFNASGVIQWANLAYTPAGGNPSGPGLLGLAVDNASSVIVTGASTGTNVVAGTPLVSVGSDDMVLAKFSSTGTLQWAKNVTINARTGVGGWPYGPSGNVRLAQGFCTIVVDSVNNIYYGGSVSPGFSANVPGSGPVVRANSLVYPYVSEGSPASLGVVKFDPSGQEQWMAVGTRLGSGGGGSHISGIAIRGNMLYLAGSFVSDTEFGTYPVSFANAPISGMNGFMARMRLLHNATVYASPTGTNANISTATAWGSAIGAANLRRAISSVPPGTTVVVANGLYQPTSNPALTEAGFWIPPGVTVLGGYAGSGTPGARVSFPSGTTLTGEMATSAITDNATSVVQLYNVPASTVLDGVVITRGFSPFGQGAGVFNGAEGAGRQSNPTLRNLIVTGNVGASALFNGPVNGVGGASNVTASPTLTNCVFSSNTTTSSGSAMINGNVGQTGTNFVSNPTLTSCTFTANIGGNNGGGLQLVSTGSTEVASPVLTNCVFSSNTATYGAALYTNAQNGGTASPVLTNCQFLSNVLSQYGAVYLYAVGGGNSSPLFRNCVFRNNPNALFVDSQNSSPASFSLVNCAFAGNLAAIYNNGGGNGSRITNCTFANNTPWSGWSGVLTTVGNSQPTSTTLTNCILFGNGTNSLATSGTSVITINHSLVDAPIGTYTGANNLTATTSPLASTATLQLLPCARAINAADPATTTATLGIATDAAGNPRLVAGRADMGAYEFQGGAPIGYMVSVQAGSWTSPTTWSCGRVPISLDPVQLQHAVTMPSSSNGANAAQSLRIQYLTGGRLLYGPSGGGQLRIGF
jgi:hypothetical protein